MDRSSLTRCPHCGQFYPPKRWPKVKMTRGQQKIFALVQRAGKHGIPSDQLFDLLYADDPDGGPLCGRRALHVRIYYLNRRLLPAGWVIRASKGGNHSPTEYVLDRL